MALWIDRAWHSGSLFRERRSESVENDRQVLWSVGNNAVGRYRCYGFDRPCLFCACHQRASEIAAGQQAQ